MTLTIRSALFVFAVAIMAIASPSAQTSDPLPSANDVVAKMIERDALRQSELTGYTVIRRYLAVNNQRRAEMLVRLDCASDGGKQFTILSEDGSGSIRKYVFQRLLSEETDASRSETRNSTRITPANYEFQLIGREALDTGPAYVLAVSPKTENKYLIDGKIWVNANDYSIVRVEGKPARNPSFWVRNVHFVHTYQKVGQFWFASSTHSTSEIRIFGSSELTIDSSDYTLSSPNDHTPGTSRLAGLTQ